MSDDERKSVDPVPASIIAVATILTDLMAMLIARGAINQQELDRRLDDSAKLIGDQYNSPQAEAMVTFVKNVTKMKVKGN